MVMKLDVAQGFQRQMTTFRIATYNIHKCRGLDRRVRPERIVDVLKETGADVIALQEVVGMDQSDRQHNQVRRIADELGFHYRIGGNRRLHGAAYGNAVLTRLPIAASHNHDITWRKSEPRGCLEVLLKLDEREATHRLRIFNVHLGTGYFERRYQSKKLLDIVKHGSRNSAPRLVLGDFNEWPRGLASQLLETHFNTAEPRRRLGRARSYPGILPLAHVDHIYYDSPLEALNVSIHRTRLALIASDHLPVVAEFRFEPT
jgi:endonuclease/exonuclease/phosphatase family metal-dependent hydrolase